jgi:oligopeptidase B
MKTDSNPLLLKINMGAGHGGRSGRYEALHDEAFRYAFVLDQIGTGPGSVVTERRALVP